MSTGSHSGFSPIRLNIPATPTEIPHPPSLSTAAPPFAPLLRAPDLLAATRPQKAWLWHGYLAPGNITLLTSQWKSGKTTLLSVLLARLKAGGQLAGLAVAAGRAVVVSEESAEDWRIRAAKLDFSDHIGWFCRPFRGRPTFSQWQALLDHIAELHAREGTALVVVDSLATFFPGKSEADALAVLETLMSLRRLADLGLSVLLLHHPRKGRVLPGQAARGSGALTSYADIVIEMRRLRRSSSVDRRRRLRGYSRYNDTPRNLVIELTAAGDDYLSQTVLDENEFHANWRMMQAILEAADEKLTQTEIRRRWPAAPVPDPRTILRWLTRAQTDGTVRRDGAGVKKSPYRYWLPAMEEKWRQDPLTFFTMPELHPNLPPGFPAPER
jgi:AAA domain